MNRPLNLPKIEIKKGRPLFPRRSMTTEEILDFLEFNLRYVVDLKAARKNKCRYPVFLPFHFD